MGIFAFYLHQKSGQESNPQCPCAQQHNALATEPPRRASRVPFQNVWVCFECASFLVCLARSSTAALSRILTYNLDHRQCPNGASPFDVCTRPAPQQGSLYIAQEQCKTKRRSSDKCANTKGGRGHRVSRKERAGLRRSMRAASPSTRAHRWASCVARAPRSQWARGGSRQVASGPVGQGAQEQSCPAHKQQQVWESWAGITPEPPRLCQCS